MQQEQWRTGEVAPYFADTGAEVCDSLAIPVVGLICGESLPLTSSFISYISSHAGWTLLCTTTARWWVSPQLLATRCAEGSASRGLAAVVYLWLNAGSAAGFERSVAFASTNTALTTAPAATMIAPTARALVKP